MAVRKNNLAKMIKQKYHTTVFSPDDELLESLFMSRERFKLLWLNQRTITFEEALHVCDVFDLGVYELYHEIETVERCLDNEKAKIETVGDFNREEFKNKLLIKRRAIA